MDKNKTTLHKLSGSYIPELAIILYAHTESGHIYGTKEYYLESHELILNSAGQYHLQAGKPLLEETLQELRNSLVQDQVKAAKHLKFSSIIPKEVLSCNNENDTYSITWFQKPTQRTLCFTKSLNLQDGPYQLPGLIFKATHNTLRVYAYIDESLHPKSRLYRAPFPNIYGDGKLCIGSTKRPTNVQSFEAAMRKWDGVFFNSYFSYLAEKSSIVEGNWHSLFKSTYKSSKPFPTDRLIPTPYTLQSILSS